MPLPRLFLPFGLGVTAYLLGGQLFTMGDILIGLIVLILVLVFPVTKWAKHYSRAWLFGCCAFCLFIVAGYFLAYQHNQYHSGNHFKHFHTKDGYLLVQVREPVSEGANTYRVIVDAVLFGNDSIRHPVEGRLILYFAKDSLVADISYGDRLVIKNGYNEVAPPQNPGAFNYRQYLARNNIFHSAYIQSGEWHHTGEVRGRRYMRLALMLREKALSVFQDNHLSGRDFAVVSALLLGYREYLDEGLRREFAGAGAMHILCVSGLHVGIIFMVLKNIFSFFTRIAGGRFIRTALIILFIWLYAAITGFSPSVLRASVMFSFVAVGQSFRRPTNIYNTLAASAFVLVFTNPNIITHIGFQLSYLAVISIVSLQPRLYSMIRTNNTILDKGWSIITVSLAAQLATGPLALYYFNQFPNYFIITNLAVIPLAGIIIYSSLLTLLLNPIPVIGIAMGQVLSIVVNGLHRSVRFIEGLPGSTTSGVYLSLPETLMIFALIATCCLYLIKGKRQCLIIGLLALFFIVTSFSLRSVRNSFQQYFVVYSINRGTAIDFITGKKTLLVACDQILSDPRQTDFNITPNRLQRGVRKSVQPLFLNDTAPVVIDNPFARKGDLIFFDGMKMLLIRDDTMDGLFETIDDHELLVSPDREDPVFPYFVDYLLITQNPHLDISIVLQYIKPGRVIIDASNSFWNAGQMEASCIEAGTDVWNVRRHGAYEGRGRMLWNGSEK